MEIEGIGVKSFKVDLFIHHIKRQQKKLTISVLLIVIHIVLKIGIVVEIIGYAFWLC